VRVDEIINYFTSRQTGGFVEDNKVKVLRWRCYEIKSLTHLFQRLFLDLNCYRVFEL
jgi:transposase